LLPLVRGGAEHAVWSWSEITVAPEERVLSPVDPDAAFGVLTGGAAAARMALLEKLGAEWVAPDGVLTDVRVMAVALDDVEGLERVLLMGQGGRTMVIVFHREEGRWCQIGWFGCGLMGARCQDQFFELRQTVRYGVEDLVVRRGASFGMGNGEGQLAGDSGVDRQRVRFRGCGDPFAG